MIDSETGSDSGASPLGAQDALKPLREHAGFITVFILSAMLSALALTYIYSERYRAVATIFFKPSDVTEVGKHGQEALGSRPPTATQKNVTQTITQLATSDVVLRRVVLDLHLDRPKARDVAGPWYRHYYRLLKYELEDFADVAWKLLKYGAIIEDPVANAMYKLNKAIKISNDDSYVYNVAVSSDSLASAATRAQKLVDVVTEILGRDDQLASEHRTAELIRLRQEKSQEIEALNTTMQSLFANNRVASLDDELKALTDRVSKLHKDRADTQADLDQSEGKVSATGDKLKITVPGGANDGSPIPIARASRISPEDYGKLTTKKLDAEIDTRGLRARLAAIDRAYNEAVPRIRVLTGVKAQEVLLDAKLASAKRDYAALTDGIQELIIRQTTGQGELRVQATPNGSMQPVSPIKIYHVGAAAALAAMIAIGLAFVLDYFQIRLFLPPTGRRRRYRPLGEGGAPEPTMTPGIAD